VSRCTPDPLPRPEDLDAVTASMVAAVRARFVELARLDAGDAPSTP
jgi:hypothetical protein